MAESSNTSGLASAQIRFPVGTDRTEFEQEARRAERVIVEVPGPEPAQRGKLGLIIEASVEDGLSALGAAPPCTSSSSSLEEILSDQLYRARLVGADGLAIAFEGLEGISDSCGALTPEDSLVLRRLVEATAAHPIQLCFSHACMGLRLYADPEPLAALFPAKAGSAPAVIEYEPLNSLHADTAASVSTMQMAGRVASETPSRERSGASDEVASEGSDDQLERMIDELLCNDGELSEPVSPRFSLAPPSLAPFTIDFAPERSNDSTTEKEQDGAAATSSMPQREPVDAAPEPRRVIGLDSLEPSSDDGKGPAEPTPELHEQTVAARADHDHGGANDEGAKHEATAQETDSGDDGRATSPADAVVVAQPPRHMDAGHADDPDSKIDPVLEQRAAQWVRELVSAQGPKPLNAIERLFVSAYVPLSDAVANGYDDPAAIEALRDFSASFERSYSDAYTTLRTSTRRPTMTVDVPDLALRLARLHGARSVELLIVDGMRYDLGQRVDALLREQASDLAACAERFLLWAGLPTTTAAQLELIGRGPGAVHEFTGNFDDDLLVNRGSGSDQIRRLRTGQREVLKLDTIEARMARAGGAGPKRLEWIAKSVSKSLTAHLEQCAPKTLVMIFGDHGFRWEPAGDRNMTIGRQGGATPEEVLVPAYAWFTGSVH